MSYQEIKEQELSEQLEHDYRASCRWAYQLLQRPDKWVCLDSETTGLPPDAELVQIAVLRPDGSVLLDTLVKPSISIPESASRIHGITNEQVESAPVFSEIYPKLKQVVGDLVIVAYNVAFDRQMVDQACHAASLPRLENHWLCCMERYAEFCGDWNDYFQSYRWQKLPSAGHNSASDCRATLRLIKKMAEAYKAEWDMNPNGEERQD